MPGEHTEIGRARLAVGGCYLLDDPLEVLGLAGGGGVRGVFVAACEVCSRSSSDDVESGMPSQTGRA